RRHRETRPDAQSICARRHGDPDGNQGCLRSQMAAQPGQGVSTCRQRALSRTGGTTVMNLPEPAAAATINPQREAELSEVVAQCHASARALEIAGGGTRTRRAASPAATPLTTSGIAGVVAYEPGELTLIARAGTPVDQIEQLLAAEGQALAFEPMDHRVLLGSSGTPTLGGVVAANGSGPRRLQ